MLVRVLPAFAVIISAVAAQSSASTCSFSTTTINSQADATALANCATVTGTVVVSSSASGTVSIDGPQQIKGDLVCENAGQLTNFGSTTLNSISGEFLLNNLTLLSTLSMTDLTSVGSINWVALQALSQLTFPSTVTKAASIVISNTFLSTLDGINVDSVSTLQIDNNPRLEVFSTQISNVTSNIDINANGQQLNVQFPNLLWAANMTLRNVSSVSIPSLAVVNGSLGFYGNYFTSISAPNLTTVGSFATGAGGLAISDNAMLTNFSMPQLTSIGGADQINDNPALRSIAFPALKTVGGAIQFQGNFTTPTMPSLVNVKGGFNITSAQTIDCSAFQSEKGNVIQGTFTCKSLTSASGSGSSTGSSSSSTSTSTKGAAASYGISEAAAGLSVIGGLLQMLL